MPRDRRRRHRQRGAAAAAPEQAAPQAHNLAGRRIPPPEWRWRTFPVFFTFSLTLFISATLVQIFSGTGVGWLIAFIGTLCAAIALSQFVVKRFIVPRMRPRRPG